MVSSSVNGKCFALQQTMAALSIGTVPTSTVNEGVNSSGVFPSALYFDGITNEGDSKVSPSPVEPSSALKSGANFATRSGSVTSAGVQTLLVRSITRSIVGCPAEKVLWKVSTLPKIASDGGAGFPIFNKSAENVNDVPSVDGRKQRLLKEQ